MTQSAPPSLLAQMAEVLNAKPELPADLEEVWRAFVFLSAQRPCGFAVEAIPPPWITDYCARLGLTAEQTDEWIELLCALDQTFRRIMQERNQPAERSST